MAFDLSSIKRGSVGERAPMIIIHGEPGVGKTTFAAQVPDCVFARAEDGLGGLDVPTFPMIESLADFYEIISTLLNEEHPFKTLVVDSLSSLESHVWAAVCADQGVETIESIGYGKGYVFARRKWQDIIAGLNELMRKNIAVILIAHTKISKTDPPQGTPYTRYEINLDHRAVDLLFQGSDIIGYAFQPVTVTKDDEKKKVGKGKGILQRQLLLEGAVPYACAKQRPGFDLPNQIDLDWSTFAQHIPHYYGE